MSDKVPETATLINLEPLAKKAMLFDETVDFFVDLRSYRFDYKDMGLEIKDDSYFVEGANYPRWRDALTALLRTIDSKHSAEVRELKNRIETLQDNRFQELERRLGAQERQVAILTEKLSQIETRKRKEIELQDGVTMHVEDADN